MLPVPRLLSQSTHPVPSHLSSSSTLDPLLPPAHSATAAQPTRTRLGATSRPQQLLLPESFAFPRHKEPLSREPRPARRGPLPRARAPGGSGRGPAAAPAARGGACCGAEPRSCEAAGRADPARRWFLLRLSRSSGTVRAREVAPLCPAPETRDGRCAPGSIVSLLFRAGAGGARGPHVPQRLLRRRAPRTPVGASPGARREMKYPKPWWSDGGGLLHLTILLSLAGLHLDLDLYLLLPPPTLLRDELLLGSGPPSPAYALDPFPASGGWGHADHLHPKGREPDPVAEPEGQLLREVRALGVPFIPRTRVDAWLVHSVAAGDSDGAHGLLGAAASSTGGASGSADGGSQAAPGGGGDPGAAPGSPLAAGEEEKAPAEPTAQVPDASGRASEVTGERGRERGARGAGQEPWGCERPGERASLLPFYPRSLGSCKFAGDSAPFLSVIRNEGRQCYRSGF